MFLKAVKFILFVWMGLSLSWNSSEQILQDTQAFEKIRKGVICIYNCEFDEAQTISQYLDKQYPNNSISYLFKGMMAYWQFFPIVPGTKEEKLFEDYLHKAVDMAETRLKVNQSDAENLLSGLGSVGLLLLYYADNGESGKVISLAPKTYQWVMKSFNFTKTYKDFYFITGLYNYYREAYAEAHPIYKPVMIFFPHGNKKMGLKQLKIASDSAIFLMAESNNFLSGIYQSFEKDPSQALFYSRRLKEAFVRNTQFKTGYIRDLLVIKKYGEAESLLNSISYATVNKYFQSQVDVMKGIIQEKKYNNKKLAEQLYLSGIAKAETYGQFGYEFSSYGYFGLSRIYSEAGKIKTAKQCHKHAKEMTPYDHINFDQ
jgi:hypothetical protein